MRAVGSGSNDDGSPLSCGRVAYIYSAAATSIHDCLPSNRWRSSIVHGLHDATGLLALPNVDIIPPTPAPAIDLLKVHTRDYLATLAQWTSGKPVSTATLAKYGLEDDCPPFREMLAHVQLAIGGSLAAARHLFKSPRHRVAIHWDGGRHHANAARAAGFCYAADVQAAIRALLDKPVAVQCEPGDAFGQARTPVPLLAQQKLQCPPRRVLYVDLDVHHGDGVERAFASDPRVVTVSVHHAAPGFYPGTGLGLDAAQDFEFASDACGGGPPRRSAINVPLAHGCTGSTWRAAVAEAVTPLIAAGPPPDYVVVQCGADGVAGDPKATAAAWNLGECDVMVTVAHIMVQCPPKTKFLLLGGGGYDHANTARVWSHLTALASTFAVRSTHFTIPPLACSKLSPLLSDPLPLEPAPQCCESEGARAQGSIAAIAAEIVKAAAVRVPLLVPDHAFSELYAPLFEMVVATRTTGEDATDVPAMRRSVRRQLQACGVILSAFQPLQLRGAKRAGGATNQAPGGLALSIPRPTTTCPNGGSTEHVIMQANHIVSPPDPTRKRRRE